MAQGKRSGRIVLYIVLIIVLLLVVGGIYLWSSLGGRLSSLLGGAPEAVGEVATPTPAPLTVEIVITTQSIPRGAEILAVALQTIKYPKDQVITDLFFEKIEDVVGKRAKYNLDPGVPLTKNMVVEQLEGSFAAFQIPKGLVAISLPMDNRLAAVSFAIEPGDHVNIIAVLDFVELDMDFQSILPNTVGMISEPSAADAENNEPAELTLNMGCGLCPLGRVENDPTFEQAIYVTPSEEQRPRMVSQTILQDVIVLNVGDFVTPEIVAPVTTEPGQPTPTPAPQQAEAQELPDTITLLVTPQDAIALNYLVYAKAKLTFVLRAANDDTREVMDAVTLQYLMDRYSIPLPAKVPFGLGYLSIPRFDPETGQFIAGGRENTLSLPEQYYIIK
jgi:pilus assembly protein CpaB